MLDDVLALRVIHLLGGLRAFDLDGENIDVGTDAHGPRVRFSRPAYAQLYTRLESLGFQPVGVQFITSPEELDGIVPSNWRAWKTPIGFQGMQVERDWANVRHAHLRQGDLAVAAIASKIKTYLRLINLRLRQISDAYYSMLRSRLVRTPGEAEIKPGKFSNLWGDEVDGAIHAYLADAASLRDALAEACWKLILKRSDLDVASIGGLIRHAKGTDSPFVGRVLSQTDEDGWIRNLTDIRNEVIHVVPVDGIHEHSFVELRDARIAQGAMYILHYPLTNSDWSLRRNVSRVVDYSNEDAVKQSVRDYDAFCAASGDALEYAWRTSSHLIVLADEIRREGSLKSEMIQVTDADIVPGSFRIIRRGATRPA